MSIDWERHVRTVAHSLEAEEGPLGSDSGSQFQPEGRGNHLAVAAVDRSRHSLLVEVEEDCCIRRVRPVVAAYHRMVGHMAAGEGTRSLAGEDTLGCTAAARIAVAASMTEAEDHIDGLNADAIRIRQHRGMPL